MNKKQLKEHLIQGNDRLREIKVDMLQLIDEAKFIMNELEEKNIITEQCHKDAKQSWLTTIESCLDIYKKRRTLTMDETINELMYVELEWKDDEREEDE